jgi:hypothetical protein
VRQPSNSRFDLACLLWRHQLAEKWGQKKLKNIAFSCISAPIFLPAYLTNDRNSLNRELLATTRNLTNGVWAKTLWGDSAKKTAGTGARLLRALHARCQDQAGNSGAEAMMLNVGHFAGLCVGYAPKRHVDLARRRVPKRPTGPDVREDVEREHLARLASAVGRRIMNVIGGLEMQGEIRPPTSRGNEAQK